MSSWSLKLMARRKVKYLFLHLTLHFSSVSLLLSSLLKQFEFKDPLQVDVSTNMKLISLLSFSFSQNRIRRHVHPIRRPIKVQPQGKKCNAQRKRSRHPPGVPGSILYGQKCWKTIRSNPLKTFILLCLSLTAAQKLALLMGSTVIEFYHIRLSREVPASSTWARTGSTAPWRTT